MSGPALKQLQAHRAIHDAAYGEADELTTVAKRFAAAGNEQAAIATASLLIEHWHTRTLRHAAEEEEGFYKEVASKYPEHAGDIFSLTRDHDLMRHLVAEAEERLATAGPLAAVLERFEMLLWLVEKHSREEELRLLDVQQHDHV